jgi:hypothetical protein
MAKALALRFPWMMLSGFWFVQVPGLWEDAEQVDCKPKALGKFRNKDNTASVTTYDISAMAKPRSQGRRQKPKNWRASSCALSKSARL